MSLKRESDNKSFDYRIEAIRIVIMLAVVAAHMYLYTIWLGKRNIVTFLLNNMNLSGLYIFLSIAFCMGILIFFSGFVYGIRNYFEDSLTKEAYVEHIKKRFLRLYPSYYLALFTVFIAKVIVCYPMKLTPISIILDLTNIWSLFFISPGGDIWAEGWFIAAVFWLAVIYPFIRRLMENNKKYIYILILFGFSFKIFLIIIGLSGYAYTHPFAWLGEFCWGILYGKNISEKGKSLRLAETKTKKAIIKMGARVLPMYLAHSAVIVFISFRPPFWEYIVAFIFILLLSEIFYRLLDYKDKILKKKGII